jgi:chromosome segregation ATPase
MKNFIVTIAGLVVLLFCITSCKEDTAELIQKIETTQIELQQQDSALITQRAELSALVFTDTTKPTEANSEDTVLTSLVNKQNALITGLELIMQNNRELITKLNNNTVNPKEAEKEYLSHIDELELMKPEINSAKEDYNKLVEIVDEAFKSLGDTTKVK